MVPVYITYLVLGFLHPVNCTRQITHSKLLHTRLKCKSVKIQAKGWLAVLHTTNSKHNQAKTANNQHISVYIFRLFITEKIQVYIFHLFITEKYTSSRFSQTQYKIQTLLIKSKICLNSQVRCTITRVLVPIHIPQALTTGTSYEGR